METPDTHDIEPQSSPPSSGGVGRFLVGLLLGFINGLAIPVVAIAMLLGDELSKATYFLLLLWLLALPVYMQFFRKYRGYLLGVLLTLGVTALLIGMCAANFRIN
jgi:hypothetical protein